MTRCSIRLSQRAELEHVWSVVHELRRAGTSQRFERLSREELRTLEPALGPDHGRRGDRPRRAAGPSRAADRGRASCAGRTRGRGARGHAGYALGPGRRGMDDRPSVSGATVRKADAVVIAAGVESARLLAAHGVRVPIAAAKGYSRTYPLDPTGPAAPALPGEPQGLDQRLRWRRARVRHARAGRPGLSLSARRLAAITAAAQRALPGWRMPAQPLDWAGMRSLSPDGLPFIGPVPGTRRRASGYGPRHARDHPGARDGRVPGGTASRSAPSRRPGRVRPGARAPARS